MPNNSSICVHFPTMASFKTHLSFFFLSVLLVFSPQIHARHTKFFSLFSHFRLSNNANDLQVILKKAKAKAPATAPALAPGPAGIPVSAPISEPVSTPAPGPAGPDPILPSVVPIPVPAPVPTESESSEPLFFANKGDSYGLYGVDSTEFSPTRETTSAVATTKGSDQNELLNEEFRTGYPKTNLYNNNNYNGEARYRNNYNSEDLYRSNYYSKNYNGQYYSGNNNGYERKREGISDTRFMENGKYYYDVKNNIDNKDTYYNNLNGYEPEEERGITHENEGYYGKNKYANEFNTMEEYEKQQQTQGYVP